MAIVDDYLRTVISKEGDELYAATGKPPQVRNAKGTTPITAKNMTTEEIETVLAEIVPARRLKETSFRFQYTCPVGNFAGLAQRENGSIEVVIRRSGRGDPALASAPAAAPAKPAAPPAAERNHSSRGRDG